LFVCLFVFLSRVIRSLHFYFRRSSEIYWHFSYI
jgi:hypothetical protein